MTESINVLQGCKESYFKIEDGKVNHSPDIRSLVTVDTKLSPMITHIFDVYGFRVPYPFTVFEGIYRLDNRNNCDVMFDGKSVFLSDPKPINSIDPSWSLESYYQALENSLKCEKKYAAVMFSSGWDSSSILGSLVQQLPKDRIKTFTLRMNIPGLDEPLNKFEIYKAKAIAEFYGVENIIVDNNFMNDIGNTLKASARKMLFSITAVNFEYLWKAIDSYGWNPSETAVYSGEFSDGAHNFGFAQHFGAVYPDKGFRQYGDKIRNYFLSPKFLNRLRTEDDMSNDILVKNFSSSALTNYLGWSEEEIMKDLLERIFMYGVRGPFEKNSITNPVYKSKSIDLYYQVIANSLEFNNLNEWYSLLLRTYNHFHWSASTVSCISIHNPSNYCLKLPFGNPELLNVLEKMPTEFGRGLEPLPTKYPLRKYCELKLRNYPFNLQEGPHAYIYDVDQSVDFVSFFSRTPIAQLITGSWKKDKYNIRKEFLASDTFNSISKDINSHSGGLKGINISLATAAHMLDEFLEYSGFISS